MTAADRRFYLDTSAYLAILLGEAGAAALSVRIRGATICSSTLFLIEAERSLIHLVRQGAMPEAHYEPALERLHSDSALYVLRDLTPDLCLTLDFPPVRTPRSSDLVHLRTAKWFQATGGLDGFLSTDAAQLKAAFELGLPA